jgi:hypothetical protein
MKAIDTASLARLLSQNKITGEQTSLKTQDKAEAQRPLQAHNDAESRDDVRLTRTRPHLGGASGGLKFSLLRKISAGVVNSALFKAISTANRSWSNGAQTEPGETIVG